MLFSRYWKWLALALTLTALVLTVGYFINKDMNSCMGISIISEEELTEKYEKMEFDFSKEISYNGQPCAADKLSYTIYISQEIPEGCDPYELPGKLSLSLSGYRLSFVDGEAFDDLRTAAKEGIYPRLAVITPDNTYTEYTVVFTTLPVIRLDGEYSHKDEQGREVNTGDICLWAPNDPTFERYSVNTSLLEWRIRGNTSSLLAKKPYKLSLKDKRGGNKDVNFLGLGADDDWILNPMNTDDTFVRENLAMQLWNDSFATEDYNATMSKGEYVEIIINGKYSGIYLLQRRMDNKLLELDTDDFLLKGTYAIFTDDPAVSYEIDYSALDTDETFEFLKSIGMPTGANIMNLDNFIDVSLFIQLGTMNDNKGYKNTYYIVEKTDEGYTLTLTLWDTDLSFASSYSDWFEYDYDGKLNGTFNRREYEDMLAEYPALTRLLGERWFELRESIFTEENIFSYIDMDREILEASGALKRDYNAWGVRHGHKDTVENLKKFISERLAILDNYYSEFIK